MRKPSDTELEDMAALPPLPKTYGDCEDAGRGSAANPCLLIRCKYNLLVDISKKGGVVINRPDLYSEWHGFAGVLESPEPVDTCALRVVDSNCEGMTLLDVGTMMNLTRERIRQLEELALRKSATLHEAREWLAEEHVEERVLSTTQQTYAQGLRERRKAGGRD